ncbi:acetyl-CoA carboxylase biotin carboxylase subunit [Lactiplantibacillus mudanjiangensis]|uniref:biotin carboxylase n=1 Tax=Lactiplantibacillus mudanjiangensis TaxID=1296538 RepID=A0A660E7W9_9LACO|nr:biotin carboxylase N-terminal domain-containing protein [Lactiplantibacillus mudanjiangensis]VDG24814.1 acetyl-CoA carboxylase, biotin carboxylase subunit [Lactobacillus plantarum JDM1] [Lactiplantibacillus mudanjiangensis]VDG28439.1 acetyl-CoA carboxylase, biotin carboxylase subunit [Lactobacillus plantarum JDM1] [Lactiplantibacillus mudanjiangensis]VDG32277.1 acetyl-CoA carboxylase, biotin carboxylase subunit [Lactobacillus plantarum JDM1] [Lactiplantibacillus mudanjiangensis]
MFHKLLIANRGEIAVRIIKACRQLNIQTVAVCSTADRQAWYTQLADEVVCIGPAAAAGSYLNAEAILMAAINTHADAIHPGYGFLAENADFAAMCAECGITWIGPKADQIELMGDKSLAKDFARSQGVPVLAGQSIQGLTWPKIKQAALEMGFPLVLKASHGGGGKGIRVINDVTALHHQLRIARAEAAASFLNDAMYLEHFLPTARHIEVQVLGTGVQLYILGDRDCSLQLHKQKVLEESPASILTAAQRTELSQLSQQLLAGAGYQSLGTIEYLFANGQFYFMEMNTRLQVEHGVTELTTGVDIVIAQIQQAAGVPLSLPATILTPKCTAIEARITASVPIEQTLITAFSWPESVRVDTGYRVGDHLSTMYDGLIAKLMVTGRDRNQAVQRLQTALAAVKLTGPATNLAFLQQTVARPAYVADDYSIHSLAEWGQPS